MITTHPRRAVVVGYARTPFARYLGRFAALPATALGAHAVSAALERSGVAPEDVEVVLMGQVLQAGAGQNPARQTARGAGIPLHVPAMTLNAVCLSGAEAVADAARRIVLGEVDVAVAGGQESMSLAPHVWTGSRQGRRFGEVTMLDTMEHDGLSDAFERRSMGASTEEENGRLGLGRAEQDAFAAASHSRAAAAADVLAEEIAPVTTPGRDASVVAADDGVRPETTAERLAALRPAFAADGTITAGNSSQITDGAAALVLMEEGEARRRGLRPLARIEAAAMVAGPGLTLHSQPSAAILRALERTPWGAANLAAVEINEAFAAVAVQSAADLGVDPAIVNPHGGAIALGHPIGASGARIVGHLARRLAALGPGSVGAAGICGGGGQGSALVLSAVG
ncbi:acetyl-CoA C-acyltransferase [Rathayibacter sp. VKM Ac-2856]|uniref:acetyl-CoA C-acyltransferase n=1 Tax=unclassified Rathayibacter TaxID=2609250 RepID=UPI0015652327|nr:MULTISPECIES: acetyl-CoA C-acyltransferase [unclassified Rathayibacter]NQX03402.1 acetyl-CoA C-acyltransferase [Rathayibacter sp. VKM Ac-2858]NQX18570.1 acetyl-CoA C-acyltransferase [Rathayibacter sp. VKM Ac-2856]